MADRFYVEGSLSLGPIELTGAEAHHLTTVRRFGPGDRISLFNGDGNEYPAEVVAVGKKRALVQVLAIDRARREMSFRLHIAAALPKGDRGDFLIEKLTELGVSDFTPLATERGVVRADDSKADKLRRAVIESSKQCGRNVLMAIHPPAKWDAWCRIQHGRRYLAHPGGDAKPPKSIAEDLVVAVGPEGGFTADETRVATEAGWDLVTLGPRILRVETACLYLAAVFGS